MKKVDFHLLGLLAIGAVFSGLIGFLVAGANNIAFDGHHHVSIGSTKIADHNSITSHSEFHKNSIILNEKDLIPTIKAELQKDPISGFNLYLITSNFRFSPELAGLKHKNGMGHAHLYIDGHKIARIYSNWHHIKEIPDGAKEITVTLNSNDHMAFVFKSAVIKSIIKLDTKTR